MKGFLFAGALCAFSNVSQAALDVPLNGIIYFTGAVVGGDCTVTTSAIGRLSESCPVDAVPHTISVQTSVNSQRARVVVRPLTEPSVHGRRQYVLVNASGNLITEGRYVISQTVL